MICSRTSVVKSLRQTTLPIEDNRVMRRQLWASALVIIAVTQFVRSPLAVWRYKGCDFRFAVYGTEVASLSFRAGQQLLFGIEVRPPEEQENCSSGLYVDEMLARRNG